MVPIDAALQATLLALAHECADAAGRAILPHFRSAVLATENKSRDGFDPVTTADRAAEDAMRAVLTRARPEDAILGEERQAIEGQSGLTWVLDPIDGTRGFLSGTPTWGVLIALSDDTGPRLGIIDQPYTAERFIGGLGEARWTGPRSGGPLQTRATRRLQDAILFSTYPEIGSPAERAAFSRVSEAVKLTRFGLDCYAYALLAMGQIDLVIEAGLKPYDVHAPIAVVRAAGGVITSWTGERADHGGTVIAAATPALHAEALRLLAQTDP